MSSISGCAIVSVDFQVWCYNRDTLCFVLHFLLFVFLFSIFFLLMLSYSLTAVVLTKDARKCFKVYATMTMIER